MGDLIDGRTPDEIKRRLKGLVFDCTGMECGECQYPDVCKENGDGKTAGYALALIERLESERDAALAKVPRWIGVEERLPEEHGIYLAHIVHRYCKIDSYSRVAVEYFSRDGEWDSLPDLYEVTHWMPLPEPPKEGE